MSGVIPAPAVTEIQPRGRLMDLQLRELWRYRDLVALLVRRDFVAQYKQTILGPLWHVINPVLTTLTFTLVFGKIAGISTGGAPTFAFYFAGNLVWGYFSRSLTTVSTTFVSNAGIFGKVYFPRLVVPVSVLFSQLIAFGIQLGVFLAVLVWYYARGVVIHTNVATLFLLPVLLLLLAALSLGFGVLVSAMTTRYRDLTQLVAFGVTLWMYVTPVVYPLATVPAKYRLYVLANPLTPIVEYFRLAFLGTGTAQPAHLAYSAAVAAVMLLLGVTWFNRVERTFMDTV